MVFLKPLIIEFGWSCTITSSVHTVTMITYTLILIPMGWLYDRYGPRKLMGVSCVLSGLGLMLSSMITLIWHLYITFGIILGIGLGPLYVSAMSTLMKWFNEKHGLAVGIATSGMGIGQLAMAPILTYLINTYGWRVAFIVMSVMMIAMLTIATLLIRSDPKDVNLLPYGVKEGLERSFIETIAFY